ncbi:hypothetical protein AALO_G00130350 [Alosa alosa]|uniref:C-type lectin domain-containing protein n=1 Tax=Alosa alosa TaxID=278164 RepID=A0AAV6GN84_9TELE|nr:hypothetical protein AALO_G00130350 [Alosa alosa]
MKATEPRSWEDARSYCRKKDSDLATPGSVEEMSRLQQSVEPKYRGDVWIGLKGAANPSPWWFLCYVENSSPKYVMIRETKTWIAAQSYCREHYVDLASIESQEDEELVWNVTEGRPVWIGLFKDSWEWVGQRRSSFRYWAAETDVRYWSRLCSGADN